MNIKVLAFGVVRDIFSGPSIDLSVSHEPDVKSFKEDLEQQYPRLRELASYLIAVNNEYALPDRIISEKDEIAIIPPVSGG